MCPGPEPAAPRCEQCSCVRALRVDNLRACQVCASTNMATVATDHACLGTGATLQIFAGVARPLIVPGAKPKAKPNAPGPSELERVVPPHDSRPCVLCGGGR